MLLYIIVCIIDRLRKGDVLLSIKDLTDLQNNINKSLEAQNVFGTVTPNFQPLWINDITRLNAQNFNSKMYVSIKEYIQENGQG